MQATPLQLLYSFARPRPVFYWHSRSPLASCLFSIPKLPPPHGR